MLHPDTELRLISSNIGHGPIATKFIPKGTLVWVLDRFDKVMSPVQAAAMPAAYQKILDRYAYVDPQGNSILCWDHARYMNHHCDPVARGILPQCQIAVRDVQPGEELTCEYAECNIDFLECGCGSPSCRREIRAHDLLDHGAKWDAEVAVALEAARKVNQPLWSFIEEPEAVKAVLEGRAPRTTMRGFFFEGMASANGNGNGSGASHAKHG